MRRRRHGRRGSRGWCRSSGHRPCARPRRIRRRALARTRLTVQPAQPAPESLPPRKPGAVSAISIRRSSAIELFSKSSRLDRWEADISRPNAADIVWISEPRPPASLAHSRSRRGGPACVRSGSRCSHSDSSWSRGTQESRNSPRCGIRSRKAAATRSHSARLRSYIPSASRRDVPESHTTIAGAGLPSGRRSWSSVSQSRNRAKPARPKRLENWSSRPEPTPTKSFSDRRSTLARSIRRGSA